MPKNINCFTIIINLEGVKKIKSQKIQQTVWTKNTFQARQKSPFNSAKYASTKGKISSFVKT